MYLNLVSSFGQTYSKTELASFIPLSMWSSRKWLVLLCKGLLIQVTHWLYCFFLIVHFSCSDTRLYVESFGPAIAMPNFLKTSNKQTRLDLRTVFSTRLRFQFEVKVKCQCLRLGLGFIVLRFMIRVTKKVNSHFNPLLWEAIDI